MNGKADTVPGTINHRLSEVEKRVKRIDREVTAIKRDMVTRTTVLWLIGLAVPCLPSVGLLLFYIGERLWG